MKISGDIINSLGLEQPKEMDTETVTRQKLSLSSSDITLLLQKVEMGLNALGIETKVVEPWNQISSHYLETVGDWPIKIKDNSKYNTNKHKSKLYFELPERAYVYMSSHSQGGQVFSFADTRVFYKNLADTIREMQKKEMEAQGKRAILEKNEEAAEKEIAKLPLYEEVINYYLKIFICNLKLLGVDYKLDLLESKETPCYPASQDVINVTIESKVVLRLETFNAEYEDSLEIIADGNGKKLEYFSHDREETNVDERMINLLKKILEK